MDWPPNQLGDYGSFLEMAFAINVLFFTWSKPGEALTDWLIQRARRERENSRVELAKTAVVSKRIFEFQQKARRSIPKWRWAAGVVATIILGAQFLLADKTPVGPWGAAVIFCAMLPLIGITLFLALPALACERKNRKEFKPQIGTLGGLDVSEIAREISGDDLPADAP